GRERSRHARGVMAEINITPFVDVMLVLLVIFMVTAPLLTAGVEVNLPQAGARAMGQPDNAPLEITLDAQGQIFMGESRVGFEAMNAKLAAIALEAPDRRVYVRADAALDYGRVVEVMAAVNQAGLA